MRTILLVFAFLTTALSSIGNVAQPGLWHAGGSNPFTLLFEEDAPFFQKIQMQREVVSIDLYPGFAVVKGQYWMHNPLDTTVRIRTGYPTNQVIDYDGKDSNRMEIGFDSLYKVRVLINGVEKSLLDYDDADAQKWRIWETNFAADTTTLIEVYFLVRTSNSQVINGSSKETLEGFIYVLETGSLWKQPIESGEIRIQFRGTMQLTDIHGVYPDSVFKIHQDGTFYLYEFENLSPTKDDNIAIVAYPRSPVDFEKILSLSEHYFRDADKTSERKVKKRLMSPHKFKDPFDLSISHLSEARNIMQWFLIIGGGTLILCTLFLFRIMMQRRKEKAAEASKE
jgi:hypothetical protein